MLTITTKKHTLYINIALLKKRLKSAITTLLKVVTTLLIIAGILLVIGTVGASDNNYIPNRIYFGQIFYGFFLCGIAWVLNFIKLVIE